MYWKVAGKEGSGGGEEWRGEEGRGGEEMRLFRREPFLGFSSGRGFCLLFSLPGGGGEDGVQQQQVGEPPPKGTT